MARTPMSAEQKEAVRARMKAYWAKKRKEQATKKRKRRKAAKVATPVSHTPSMVVRVIATREGGGLTMHEHGVSSWGGLVDLLHDSYHGQFIEALIRKG